MCFPDPKMQTVMKLNNFPTENYCIFINIKWFAWTPTMQTENYADLGFSNVHAYGAMRVIINIINLADTHRQNTVILHRLLKEKLTTQVWSPFLSFSGYFRIWTNTYFQTNTFSLLRQLSLTASIEPLRIIINLWVFFIINTIDMLLLIFKTNFQRP